MQYDEHGMPIEKVWDEPKLEELVEGYQLPVDEDGEWNPKIYEAMVNFVRANPQYRIEDKRPECFEIAEAPKPSAEEIYNQKANNVRSIRSQYMADTLNKVERYDTQKAAGIDTTDSAETYKNYLLYLQYLRDIPQSADFPNIEVLTFEKWIEGLK